MSQPDFSDINKSSAETFRIQRDLIRDLCRGKQVTCPVCRGPLEMVGPSKKPGSKPAGVYCKKGCTSIELEFES